MFLMLEQVPQICCIVEEPLFWKQLRGGLGANLRSALVGDGLESKEKAQNKSMKNSEARIKSNTKYICRLCIWRRKNEMTARVEMGRRNMKKNIQRKQINGF